MHMKQPLLFLFVTATALASCQTAHDAAVAGFRVIDAPHQYIRRELGIDNEGNTTTTTSTTTVQTNAPPNDNVYQQPVTEAPPPPPPPRYTERTETVTVPPPPQPTPHRVVVTERRRETISTPPTPTPAPRVTSHTTVTSSQTHTTHPKTTPPPRTEVSDKGNLPYGKPVPGKPGYVFSPYDKNGGYVDVTGFAPGSKVKDPYSGKVFLVP